MPLRSIQNGEKGEDLFLTMNVVTRHMMTITEKVFVLKIPALTPSVQCSVVQ